MGRRQTSYFLIAFLALTSLCFAGDSNDSLNSVKAVREMRRIEAELKARRERERRETERRFHESRMEELLREQNDILRNQGVKIYQ